MANVLYELGREAFLDGSADWDTDTFKLALMNASYTQNLTTDKFMSTLTANVVVRTTAITGKTVTLGVADGAIALLTAVTGAACTKAVLFKDTGSDATSRLIASYDISYTPSGNDLQIAFSTGANKAFKL